VRESAPTHAHEGQDDPEQAQQTICPLHLTEIAERTGIVAQFCDRYRAEPEQIHHAVREFVTYWTIGEGTGRRQFNWPRKLRKHLQTTCERPGGLKALGELGHEELTRETKRQLSRDAGAMALMREAEELASGAHPRARPPLAPVKAAPAGALVSDLSKALGGRA
jgi:hypothetical protein